MSQLCCFTGTKWLLQIVWLIVNGTNGEDDGLNTHQRYHFIEAEMAGLVKDSVRQQRNPKLLRSHMPYSCLPAAVEAGYGKVKALQ